MGLVGVVCGHPWDRRGAGGRRSRPCCADAGPEVVVKGLEQEVPTWAMTAEDAAALGRCRRGVEPLRIVVMPQYDRQTITAPVVEPMPVLV
jgi:hypothetical protein